MQHFSQQIWEMVLGTKTQKLYSYRTTVLSTGQ